MPDPTDLPGRTRRELSGSTSQLVDWSLFEGPNDNRPQRFAETPFWRLGELLLRHEERDRKEGRAWSPARYRNGATRGNDGIEAITALAFDFDHEEPPWELFEDRYSFLAHTSYRHYAEHKECGRPDCPHWRVVFPLAREVSAEEYNDVWERTTRLLCPNADDGSKGAARLLYLPTRQPGRLGDVRAGDGRAINPDLLPPLPPKELPSQSPAVDGDRPGDRFISETTWSEILEPHNWTLVSRRGGVEYWRRPGKAEHHSATANGGGYELLYVFSSSAAPFEANTSYSRFAAHALLNHDGDYSAAARALARRHGPRLNHQPQIDDGDEDHRRARIRWLREEDIKPIRFLEEGRIPLGSLTSQTADGGMAKGLWSCRRAALLTLGQLPGAYYGTPINVFVIGTAEDSYEVLTSRIKAAGGDVRRVASLEHQLDQELDLVADIDLIEKAIQEGDFRAGWLDQLLDHFPDDNNSHVQKDVRKTLRPMQRLCNRLDIAVWFHAHPSLSSSGPRGIREGGSVQFRNVTRSALIIGWHPNVDGVRVAHSKFNGGPLATSITFATEPATVISP
jgi:AAA domain